jgi:multidrug efflux pump subunit AcrB
MKGLVEYMARNGVAANLLMALLIVVGVASLLTIEQQVFPEFSLDTIQVEVLYPGASPEEVEDGIIQRIEERVETVEGVKEIRGTAAEGVGFVIIELQLGADLQQALDRVKAEVDRITTFPEDAEEPEVRELTNRTRVVQLAIFGDASERALKEIAERAENELTAKSGVTDVEVSGVRDYEISIEVSRDALRSYGLTLPEVAAAVRRASLDLPGGTIETDREEVTIRTEGQNYTKSDYQDVVVRGTAAGATVRLGDLATIEDGFAERSDLITRFNGQPAAFVNVFRAEGERVLDVVQAVETYVDEELKPSLPNGVEATIWRNEAESLRSRLSLLVKNGLMGLVLVVIALTLFLNPRLAFWTAAGIGIAFIGTFGVMRLWGVTINQLSLFGFILAIGIVVDDAIVVGENVYAERERGAKGLRASIRGTKRVVVPVIFAVLTTIAAFVPLLFVPGTTGKITQPIPQVVILVLLLSLVESLLILPHHLSKSKLGKREKNVVLRKLNDVQAWIDGKLKRFVNGPLDTFIDFCTRHYGIAIAFGVAALILTVGLLRAGYVRFQFLPTIEGEYVTASLEMPVGTTAERTEAVAALLRERGQAVADSIAGTQQDDAPAFAQNVYTSVGLQPSSQGGPGGSATQFVQPSVAEVTFQLSDANQREIPASDFETAWRDAVGGVPTAQALTFSANLIQLGKPVNVQLSAPSPEALEGAVDDLKRRLRQIGGVFDVQDDRGQGKREVELRLKPFARTLGLTLDDLARQVRAGYFGAEALRVQRGQNEVRVYVRLPEAERDAVADLDGYRIRTPSGGAVPLEQVADVSFGTGPATIRREGGQRVVTVTADTDPNVATGQEVTSQLRSDVLPDLQERYNELSFAFGGEQEQQQDSLSAILRNFGLALFVIFALLAIPFRSYLQPLVIMAAIPFGFVGAVVGHFLLGIPIGLLSLFGIIGLSGVVVNDSLVMIDFINDERMQGKPMREAIVAGAKGRFRPILLTSLTTFLGVFPLIIEQSVQAQFLVPMAVSLGFGIVFATPILMGLVPALQMAQFDGVRWFQTRLLGRPADEVEIVHASQRGEADDDDDDNDDPQNGRTNGPPADRNADPSADREPETTADTA